jgi:hypothetical protein
MNAERFYAGKTFTEFLESAVKLKDLWEGTYKRVEVPAEYVTALEAVPGKWHLLALSEDWCLDAVTTVTPVARLCELAINADFRLLERDKNLDIMDTHLTNGGRSIPIIILYDDTWTERAWWGPRPRELQAWVMEWIAKYGKSGPTDEKYRYIRGWYARDKGQSALKEVLEMVVKAGESLTTSE